MSKKKKKQQNQNSTYESSKSIKVASTINGKKSIYTNKVKSLDGKKPDKRTCVHYDKGTGKCSNKNCSTIICTTSRGCTGFKRKEKPKKRILDDSWENFLPLPQKSGIKDLSVSSGVLKDKIGVPAHIGYLHGDGVRRDRRRCIHYDRLRKFCLLLLQKCTGSSRCDSYREK